jgi:hypothetical protein
MALPMMRAAGQYTHNEVRLMAHTVDILDDQLHPSSL